MAGGDDNRTQLLRRLRLRCGTGNGSLALRAGEGVVAAVGREDAVHEDARLRLHRLDADLVAGKRLGLEGYLEFMARPCGRGTSLHQPFDVMDVVDVSVEVDVAAARAERKRVCGALAAVPANPLKLPVAVMLGGLSPHTY